MPSHFAPIRINSPPEFHLHDGRPSKCAYNGRNSRGTGDNLFHNKQRVKTIRLKLLRKKEVKRTKMPLFNVQCLTDLILEKTFTERVIVLATHFQLVYLIGNKLEMQRNKFCKETNLTQRDKFWRFVTTKIIMSFQLHAQHAGTHFLQLESRARTFSLSWLSVTPMLMSVWGVMSWRKLMSS